MIRNTFNGPGHASSVRALLLNILYVLCDDCAMGLISVTYATPTTLLGIKLDRRAFSKVYLSSHYLKKNSFFIIYNDEKESIGINEVLV